MISSSNLLEPFMASRYLNPLCPRGFLLNSLSTSVVLGMCLSLCRHTYLRLGHHHSRRHTGGHHRDVRQCRPAYMGGHWFSLGLNLRHSSCVRVRATLFVPMLNLKAIARAAFYAVYDLKMLFICSVLLFEVGSSLCGAAPNMNALIVGRVLAGIGGSGIYIGYATSLASHVASSQQHR